MAERPVLSALAVVGASLLLGGLTSWAQGVLPDALASFANSPSGWTVLTALVVAAARPTLAWGAALGAASFVSLVLGYTIASELRGLTYNPVLWRSSPSSPARSSAPRLPRSPEATPSRSRSARAPSRVCWSPTGSMG
ncbi:hypothetical protein LQK93_03420 [Terrabacter sp. BE26]